MNLIKSIFKFRCPQCRKGKLFINNNPYRLRQLNKMYDNCHVCNLKFSIEPGFYQGAAYVSYALQVLNSLIIFNILYWLLDIYWQQIVYYIFGSIVLLTPYIVVLSRTIWLYLFVSFDPNKKQ